VFVVLVAEGASRLRRMPMSALPPKMPPGLDLPEGAISAEFARRLRLGDYMLRLDSSCIHTSLKPRECAIQLTRTALKGDSSKIQFVSTEKVCLLPACLQSCVLLLATLSLITPARETSTPEKWDEISG
jgi:hypothetical protein